MRALLFIIALLLISSLNAKDVILDTTTSLLWQDAPINKYKNFRLPTLHELQTLVDYKNYNPAILNGFKHVENTTYWTSTVFADAHDERWTVDFEKGSRSVKATYYDRHFRCVQKLK